MFKFMSKAMKKARILSSESDASIKVKQDQNTNIDLSIAPPAQSVNFQPSPMAELATMEHPIMTQKPSTFKPFSAEETLISRPRGRNMLLDSQLHPMVRPMYASKQMDGPFVPVSDQITVKVSQSQTEDVISRDIEETPEKEPTKVADEKNADKKDAPRKKEQPTRQIDQLPNFEQRGTPISASLPTLKRRHTQMSEPVVQKKDTIDESIIDGPFIEQPIQINEQTAVIDPIPVADISIIDELKRPMDMVSKSFTPDQVQRSLREILDEKTKKASILEAMLEIYKSKHQTINGLLTCKERQLESLIKAYTNATSVELMSENMGGCGCSASAPKIIDIESIIVTVGGKAFDFRFAFNDAYADMLRHGINLKQFIA
jgi:hypothetical protein